MFTDKYITRSDTVNEDWHKKLSNILY
jgi:hypothetical protein